MCKKHPWEIPNGRGECLACASDKVVAAYVAKTKRIGGEKSDIAFHRGAGLGGAWATMARGSQ